MSGARHRFAAIFLRIYNAKRRGDLLPGRDSGGGAILV